MNCNTHFILDKTKINKKGQATIFLRLFTKNNEIKISTKQKCKPTEWDNKKERIKSKHYLSGSIKINEYLNKIEEKANLYKHEYTISETSILKEKLRSCIDEILGIQNSNILNNSFTKYLSDFIQRNPNSYVGNTLRNYRLTLNYLKKFEKLNNITLSIHNLDLKFQEKFTHYLMKDLGISDNSIARQFVNIKCVLSYAENVDKIHVNLEYKKFKTVEKPGVIISLNSTQIKEFENYKPSTKSHELARDIFLFSCYTGLRWNEIKALKADNIKGGFIEFVQNKVDQMIRIPFNNKTKELIEKYKGENSIFPSISSQTINIKLKEIAFDIGFLNKITIVEHKNKKAIEFHEPLYKKISFHVARKSFTTILCHKNVALPDIMKLTGHKKLSSVQRYMGTSEERLKEAVRIFDL